MRRLRLFVILLILLFLAGCTGPASPSGSGSADANSPLVEQDTEYVVIIVLDLSGSYFDKMLKDGKAYQFALHVIDKYFRQRLGCNDRLIIAQVSAVSKRAPLWDGSPLQLRQRFPDADAFREFVVARSDPNGSRIHLGVAEILEYAMTDVRVRSGKARTAAFILSDMDDNAPDTAGSEQRLVKAFAEYGRLNGVVALLWVDFGFVGRWQRHLQEAGVKKFQVTADIVEQPPLPDFDQ